MRRTKQPSNLSSFYGGMRGGGGFGRSRVGFKGTPERERSSFKHLGHLKKLFPYVRRYAWIIAFAIVALLIQRVAMALVPQFMRTAIDSLTYPEIPVNVLLPALAILAVVVLQFIIYVPARRALRRVSIAVTYDLRKRYFRNVQYQGPGFFNSFSTGDLMSRAVNDVSMVRMAVSYGWVQVFMILFQLIAGLYFMFMMSPVLTVATILPLPFVAVVGYLLARGMYPYFIERQQAMSEVTTFAQENLNGIRTIQAMAQEDKEIERFRATSTKYIKKAYRAARYQQIMGLTMSGLTMISPLIILGFGGSLVLNGSITLGTYSAFSAYLWMVTSSVQMIGWSLSMFTSAAAGTERIFEIVEHVPEVADEPNLKVPEQPTARLQIKNLTYSYPEATQPAIRDINIDVEPGETIAFLGRLGCGKSTILKAIVRLLNIPSDTVYFDGIDICKYPIKKLREEIALVPQYAFLFSATLRDNVSYDDTDREDEPIWEAIQAAGLEETVKEDLVAGLDTIVGERGVTLSGGQKQRATLARGLIRDSKILLLDDCFSSVDTETEERIIQGLNTLRADKTTLLISHRVSTARHADRIFVVDNGRIIESGSHDELIASGGYYADLEAVQSNQDEDNSKRARLIESLRRNDNAIEEVQAS